MKTTNLVNSIHGILDDLAWDSISLADAKVAVGNIIASELWTHTSDEVLSLADLTDEEFRFVTMWAISNKGDNRMQTIRDMREIFPGIGLATANALVR